MTAVVDASATLSLVLPSEVGAVTAARVAEGVVVPPLWRYEVANGLVMAARRGRTTDADAVRAGTLLARLPIVTDEAGQGIAELHAVATRYTLTAYDAAYLSLSLHRGLALVTGDRQLARAAASAGVPTIGPAATPSDPS